MAVIRSRVSQYSAKSCCCSSSVSIVAMARSEPPARALATSACWAEKSSDSDLTARAISPRSGSASVMGSSGPPAVRTSTMCSRKRISLSPCPSEGSSPLTLSITRPSRPPKGRHASALDRASMFSPERPLVSAWASSSSGSMDTNARVTPSDAPGSTASARRASRSNAVSLGNAPASDAPKASAPPIAEDSCNSPWSSESRSGATPEIQAARRLGSLATERSIAEASASRAEGSASTGPPAASAAGASEPALWAVSRIAMSDTWMEPTPAPSSTGPNPPLARRSEGSRASAVTKASTSSAEQGAVNATSATPWLRSRSATSAAPGTMPGIATPSNDSPSRSTCSAAKSRPSSRRMTSSAAVSAAWRGIGLAAG